MVKHAKKQDDIEPLAERGDAGGAAPLHLQRVESAVTADVEHRPPAQIGRDRVGEALPFDRRVIAEEMVGRGLDPAEIDIVKPGPELADGFADLIHREFRHQRRLAANWSGATWRTALL